jgi:DNA-binding protein HU-beta
VNKSELVNNIATNANISQKAAAAALDATVSEITSALARGEHVQLVGFGTFKAQHRPAGTRRHPRTGEPMQVEAKSVPVFKAGASLKAAVKG